MKLTQQYFNNRLGQYTVEYIKYSYIFNYIQSIFNIDQLILNDKSYYITTHYGINFSWIDEDMQSILGINLQMFQDQYPKFKLYHSELPITKTIETIIIGNDIKDFYNLKRDMKSYIENSMYESSKLKLINKNKSLKILNEFTVDKPGKYWKDGSSLTLTHDIVNKAKNI